MFSYMLVWLDNRLKQSELEDKRGELVQSAVLPWKPCYVASWCGRVNGVWANDAAAAAIDRQVTHLTHHVPVTHHLRLQTPSGRCMRVAISSRHAQAAPWLVNTCGHVNNVELMLKQHILQTLNDLHALSTYPTCKTQHINQTRICNVLNRQTRHFWQQGANDRLRQMWLGYVGFWLSESNSAAHAGNQYRTRHKIEFFPRHFH